ncbi:MAG: aldehyde dehydrogenase family protein [Saprospiraceae bacterium]
MTTNQLNNITSIFETQNLNLDKLRKSTASERIKKINLITKYLSISKNEKALADAMYKDMKKPYEDVIISEIVPIFSQIKAIKSNLRRWMRHKEVSTPKLLAGLTSYIQHEPKGRILIISPWNYPFQLSIWPMVYAIAAGNAVIIKPSEVSSNVSNYIANMISTLFDPKEVAVIQGGVLETTQLLNLPFDHIHFTGSSQVGKIIMQAGAKNLSSVTLELGGKSPTIVDKTANIKSAAQKIAWGKLLNCGQTCIAPDYLFLHEDIKDKFLDSLEYYIEKLYNNDKSGIQSSSAYGRIINEKHFDRISALLTDAKNKNAIVHIGGNSDRTDKYISPTVISEVNNNMNIMNEEIFGPILPIIIFDNINNLPTQIKRLPKPLSLYIFSNSRKNINYILDNVSSGGAMVNDLMIGPVNTNLPFGGVNNSGHGKANGIHGFLDFCNEKGVMKRSWGTLSMVYPPYIPRIFKIMKWASKRFS